MNERIKRAESVPSRYRPRVDMLARKIRDNPVNMAVVDCLGFMDSDEHGRVTKIGRDDPRRYDYRSAAHVVVYGLPVVQMNEAWLSRL